LARDRHVKGFPEFEQFYITGFPMSTQFGLSPLRLPIPPRPLCQGGYRSSAPRRQVGAAIAQYYHLPGGTRLIDQRDAIKGSRVNNAFPSFAADADCWVFDLDNTLYPASADLFGLMDGRMAAFVSRVTGADAQEAKLIQKRFFREHGTTLSGLMANHDVDPHEYLAFVHDIPLDRLEPDATLAKAIDALPGRKIIFTNADEPYARRVLEKRGLADCFEAMFDIHDAAYAPKPDPAAYDRFCADHAIDPARAIMFEDMARNLKPAKALGMATVWINNGSEYGEAEACPSFIDAETHCLSHYLTELTGAYPA
jgi:putative hydrolase of the HAD superfamily